MATGIDAAGGNAGATGDAVDASTRDARDPFD
jgi:hypothetical protein